MADRILMNKNSLSYLKAELKEYKTAVPVFEMKEQKLKAVVQILENSIARLGSSIDKTNEETTTWVGVMAEENVNLSEMVKVDRIITAEREIAGVAIEEFQDIEFENIELDLYNTPLWMDTAIEVIQDQMTNRVLLEIDKRNLELLREELTEARRMKNALIEVFIPETAENIRKIEIYLGDVERLAIGCAKLLKKKKEKKNTGV
jgi:V/A-type H+-transporting ATPase subunit D